MGLDGRVLRVRYTESIHDEVVFVNAFGDFRNGNRPDALFAFDQRSGRAKLPYHFHFLSMLCLDPERGLAFLRNLR